MNLQMFQSNQFKKKYRFLHRKQLLNMKSRSTLKILITAVVVFISAISFGAIPLAENSKPTAEIVIDKSADQTLKFAADELCLWVKQISGAKLPIVNRVSDSKTKLFLSCNPEVLKKFPDDAEKLKGNDGYAVRTDGNNVYLFASRPKGILNGIYRLLFKNSDIIWARPNKEFGTIYTADPDFSLSQTDYIDIPVYKLRGWQTLGKATNLWQVRNGSNWNAVNVNSPVKRKQGMILEFGGGHNLNSIYITGEKYWDKHPEFFPVIKGKRKRPFKSGAKTQLCFTNPAMTKAFIAELDKLVKANPQYETYRIMIEDNRDQCECAECRKPIRLPDGKILTQNAKNYYSTRFFIWLNTIARYMQKHYPGKRILTFAYFFTEVSPAVKIASNIDISFCPIFKNSKFPMDSPQNAKTNKILKGWLRNTHNITLREYFGLTGSVPRAVDAIALEDWRYANENGNCENLFGNLF